MTGPPACSVPRDRVSALLLGAGSGLRIGQPKAFLEVGGRTLLEQGVEQVQAFASEIVVGLRPEDIEPGARVLHDSRAVLVAGGATRHDTVERLLARATRPLILLHEVARPLAPPELFAAVLSAAHEFGAAAPYLPASLRDSVALKVGEFLGASLPRDDVVQTQTPQAFRREMLVEVCREATANGWLEPTVSVPALCARAGRRVRLVPGDPGNVKITFPEDWEAVRSKLMNDR